MQSNTLFCPGKSRVSSSLKGVGAMGKTPVYGWVVSDVVMAIGLVDKNKDLLKFKII
jgi:hypothetical protein